MNYLDEKGIDYLEKWYSESEYHQDQIQKIHEENKSMTKDEQSSEVWTDEQIEYAIDIVIGDDGTTSEQVLDILKNATV
tara:strand:- start:164 stop:400 length:237 start_codon:yes stop_codon:yes gene_type:complete